MEQTQKTRLTNQQLTILDLIYRFRFVSTKHVQQALGIKYPGNVQARLNLLVDKGYIGRRYEPSYKLAGLPAAYFILPGGMAVLKDQNPDIDRASLRYAYKDPTATDEFVRRCLLIGDVHVELAKQYGDNLEFFTKAECRGYDYFPKPLPDAFIRVAQPDRRPKAREYFLEICADTVPAFVHRRCIQQYIDYADEGEWEAALETKLPAVLLVCTTPALQAKLSRLAKRMLDDAYEEELQIVAVSPGIVAREA